MEGKQRNGIPGTFPTFAAVNDKLAQAAHDAPAGGAYDKTDFLIVWTDGNTYQGRFDLHRLGERQETRDGSLRLEQHVLDHVGFYAGTYRPVHMTADKIAAIRGHNPKQCDDALDLLALYAFDDKE